MIIYHKHERYFVEFNSDCETHTVRFYDRAGRCRTLYPSRPRYGEVMDKYHEADGDGKAWMAAVALNVAYMRNVEEERFLPSDHDRMVKSLVDMIEQQTNSMERAK